MSTKKDVVLPPGFPHVSLTIPQFCIAEGKSIAAYYDERKRGLGPKEHCPPGSKSIRITPEARAEYHHRHLVENIEDNPVRVALREKAIRGGKNSIASPERYQNKKKSERPQKRRVA